MVVGGLQTVPSFSIAGVLIPLVSPHSLFHHTFPPVQIYTCTLFTHSSLFGAYDGSLKGLGHEIRIVLKWYGLIGLG